MFDEFEPTSSVTSQSHENPQRMRNQQCTQGGEIGRSCRISPSIVLIGQWNSKESRCISICSGFIVDATRGLVVTGSDISTSLLSSKEFCHGDHLVVGCNNHSVNGFSHIYAAEIMGDDDDQRTPERQMLQPSVLRLTHIFRLSRQAEKTQSVSNNIDQKMATMTSTPDGGNRTPGSGATCIPHLIPVTAEHLHSIYELGMSETIDVCGKIRVVGYDQHSRRPSCIAEGYVNPHHLTSPHSVVVEPMRQYCVTDQMLGGPCITDDGRVIGLAVQMERESGKFLIATAPFMEAIIEKMQMKCDAVLYR